MTSTAIVNVTIFPSNNQFPPVLESVYVVKVEENNPVNASILTITATDGDMLSPANLVGRFILSGANAVYFHIENLGNNIAILRARWEQPFCMRRGGEECKCLMVVQRTLEIKINKETDFWYD